jgi:hypothetical protein
LPRIEVSLDSDVPADRVFAAITDFTDRRPDLWPNISRKFYEVHATGDNWAEATEGTEVIGGIWARERYEWSPGQVRATVMGSNVCKSGIWEMRISPRDGGSHIEIVNHRQFKGKGHVLAAGLVLMGRPALKHDLKKTLDMLREERRTNNGGE